MNQPNDAEVLLDAATQYLEIVGGGTLKALAIRMPPMATILPSEEVLTSAREAAIRQQQERWSGQLRTIVDAWSPRAARHGVRTECVEIEGDAADVVVQQGWHADAVVVARPTSHDTPRMHDCMHAALFETGCPVLVVPPEFEGPLGQVVAIAWKDDPRAAAAVRASLPLLSKARQVYVLRAGASVEPPSILMEHDIKADITVVPDGEGTVGERILHAAHQFGVDLLVMGAFSHTQWRERLFGGVTRTMFAKADIPLLMRH